MYLKDIIRGRITDQIQLAKLYSMADVTLLTSKKDTFSMIVAESLCCGTPVVGFKAGAPELISLQEYSEFVDYADVSKLRGALNIALKEKHAASSVSSSAVHTY